MPALYNADKLHEQPIPVCDLAELPIGDMDATFDNEDVPADFAVSPIDDTNATFDNVDAPDDFFDPIVNDTTSSFECVNTTNDCAESTGGCNGQMLSSTLRAKSQPRSKKRLLSSGKTGRYGMKSKMRKLHFKNSAFGQKYKRALKSKNKSFFLESENTANTEANELNNISSIPPTTGIDLCATFCKPEPSFEPMETADEQAVESLFSEWEHGDDDEISWRGTMPGPMTDANALKIKANDKLSGNIPFATNVRGMGRIYWYFFHTHA